VPRIGRKMTVPAANFTIYAIIFLGQAISFILFLSLLVGNGQLAILGNPVHENEGVQIFLIVTLIILAAGMLMIGFFMYETVRRSIVEWRQSGQTGSFWNAPIKELIKLQKKRRQSSPFSHVLHEIKTPLAVIRGYAQLAAQCGEEEYDMIHSMLLGIDREVENLVWMMEVIGGKENMGTQPISLCALVQECVKGYEMIAGEKRWSLSCGDDIILDCNRSAVMEILRTILDNAVKYTADDGTIDVFVGVRKSNAYVRVTDNGIGIDGKDLENIFRKYYRGNAVQDYNGSGYGLYLAYRVANCFGIKINVESEVGKGSSFTIWFPKNCMICQ
jgi:signal transduction histidine kinase